MRILSGIAASPGVAIGEALIVDRGGFQIPRRYLARDAVGAELERLDRALEELAQDLEFRREAVARQLGDQSAAIFAAHAQMVRDPGLYRELTSLIRDDYFTAEFAVSRTIQRYSQIFQQAGGGHLAERVPDLWDLERGLLAKLLGEPRELWAQVKSPVVLIAHDLTPGETALLDPRLVLGFATEIGGAGGHTAIVAKGLEIPACVGLGELLSDVNPGDTVVVDGDHGRIVLRPDDDTLRSFRRECEARLVRERELISLRDLPAETADGCRLKILANLEFPREAAASLDRGADGVGLYRTEFLYLGSAVEPSEEQHYEAYSSVIKAMGGRPVVIRTQDLGADKLGQQAVAEVERNPCLGLRSIRLSLRNLPGFRTQLRAILRASALGPVKIMFPLIATLSDLRQARMVLADAMEDLEEAGLSFDRQIEVGMMVEVPSAVFLIDRFLAEVSFLSIGTNDLIQYALAVDRGNTAVADRYQGGDPSVLRMLDWTIRSANQAEVPVTVCGQMSGDPLYTMLLLGLGLRSWSVPPAVIPHIKRICRSVTLPQCQAVARRALTMDSAREIDSFLRDSLRQAVPEAVELVPHP